MQVSKTNFTDTIKQMIDVYNTSIFLKSSSVKNIDNREWGKIFLILFGCSSMVATIYIFLEAIINPTEGSETFFAVGFIFLLFACSCFFLLVDLYENIGILKLITKIKQTCFLKPYYLWKRKNMIKAKNQLEQNIVKHYNEISVWFGKENYVALGVLINEQRFPTKSDGYLFRDTIKNLENKLSEVTKNRTTECDFLSHDEIKNLSQNIKGEELNFFEKS